MSIKDLFNNPGAKKIQGSATSDEMVENVESQEYVEAKKAEFEQFVPPIDFATASNFAKFGSAELYYEKAFERIHKYYPYDGTLAEKTEFHNSSSYLDKHVFDNLYPRTTGYVNLDGEYITVFGGPHTASADMISNPLEETFDQSMVYNVSDKRTSAFEFRGDDGLTIEFWLKVPNVNASRTIMHVTGAFAGEIKLSLLSSDALQVEIGSGATQTETVLNNAIASAFDVWNHYAIMIQSSSAGLTYHGYKNGQHQKQTNGAYFIGDILPNTQGLNMTIGANDGGGGNKLTGSLDEFRYWKKTRTPEAIFNSWFVPVGGGTNKYSSNIDLGLYFKFNEGITTSTAIDNIALDYSGRINNGAIQNYRPGITRNTGSAIAEKLSEAEFLDPIIYSTHPDVVAKKAQYKATGSLADNENSSMLLSYFPAWMQEEDEQNGKQLKYLAQVLGSYFDTLWHQINFVDRIHDHHYISGSNKALPFAKKLLYDRGFVLPDLFVDATITENLLQKDDNEVYGKQINEVRNTIYHNIYNNLEAIYKSKGTEKSFRNFFRSIGIGQEVVKLRMYADDSTFVLRDNYEHKSYERKYLNFNHEGQFDATLYQTSSADNTNAHIPGDTNYSGSFTLETEIILPRKNRSNESNYIPLSGLTASIAGFHTSGSHPTPYTHPGSDQDLAIYVVKESLDGALNPDESHRVRFKVKGAFGEIVSPLSTYQYENNKWNLAVRLRHENYPFANVSGNVPRNYVVEFYGVESDGNRKRNSFHLSSSINADYFTSNKIFYAGAHRTNFVGSTVYNTDIKLGYLRYWHSNLSNDAIDQHAFDSETFGANEPFENDLVNTYPIEIPREKTLAFHWAFNDLTTSDGSGELLVSDLSSGSISSDYGALSDTIQRYVQGRATGFNVSSQKALDKTYVQTARKRLPDDLMSSDLTIIKSDETEQFFVDEDVSDNFYSFEKSMYGAISDEMMNMFSTALDLNNLIGQPNQKYHHRYNLAEFLRDRFYEDVENEPDIEKFTSFYKWIDDSISIALKQLTPASARFSEKINNIIESHVLERNKYVHQVPIVTTFQSTEGSIKGISEMKYDWKHGHAPFFPDEEQTNTLWQRERKEKDGLRETLRVSNNNHSIQSSGLVRREVDGSTRISDVYAIRKFAKTYDLTMVSQQSIHGGINFSKRKNIQLFHEAIAPAGALGTTSGTPQNIITVGVGGADGITRGTRDEDNPPRKRVFNSNALIGKLEGQDYGHSIDGNTLLPLNLMSGTVHSGYNKEVKSNFASDVILTNLHHDTVGNYNETPLQGPFTETHVGGLQYRHIDINQHSLSKEVSVGSITGGSFPTASVEFTTSVLSSKLTAGTGSFVTIKDGDGTTVTALYSNVFDLFDNQWTDMDELVFIINNKLDMTTNKVSDSFLELTQSVTGNFYNYSIQASAHGFITASGFGGGTPLTSTSTTVNLDGPVNRPEGWGLVFKDHPSQGDNDGSFGFIGADYGVGYPNPFKLKATRYRDETAKRPVNIRNIKTTSSSQKAGNYSNEIQIFSIASDKQKTWAIEAYDDANIDILPPFISTSLPNTTHYQTLMGIAPLPSGNVFSPSVDSNRQPDATSHEMVTAVTGVTASSISFSVLGKDYVKDLDKITFDFPGLFVQDVTFALDLQKSAGLSFSHPLSHIRILTGSSDTEFYNNILLKMTGSGSPDFGMRLGATYTDSPIEMSNGLHWSKRDAVFILASGSAANKYPDNSTHPVTVAFWTHISGALGGVNRVFYHEESDSGAGGSRLSIRHEGGADRLRVKVNYDDGGLRNNYYDLTPFAPLYFNSSSAQVHPTHFAFTYDGGVVGGSVKVYINGVSSSFDSVYVATGTGTPERPDGDLYIGGFGATETVAGQLQSSSSMDEIFILKKAANAAEIHDLYHGGIKINPESDGFKHLDYSSDVATHLDFNDYPHGRYLVTGDVITSATPLGVSAMNFTASSAVPNGLRVGRTQLVENPPSASFTLSGSDAGHIYNGSISVSGAHSFPDLQSFFTSPSTNSMSNGVTAADAVLRFSNDNVIPSPRVDLTGSERNINTRFSAPGGPEVQSIGYLDAYSSTFSVHNALPFRNLSVLGSGSGESGTIRVVDHLGHRRGLKTLRALHMGQFGIDAEYGSTTSANYSTNGSFNKQHRNRSKAYQYSSGLLIITGSNHDNMHINSPIPRSEFQYSWIRAAISGSNWEDGQRILGYAPRDGIVSSSAGYVEALVFPSASTIIGSL